VSADTASASMDTAAGEEAAAASARELALRKRRRRRIRAVRSFLVRLVLLAVVVYVLFFHVVGLTSAPNGDMYPRVDAGDLVLFYRLDSSWKAQDIVVIDKAVREDYSALPRVKRQKVWWRSALDWLGFVDPDDPPVTRFIGRVVAAPGDTVEVTDSQRLIINGNAMIESGIFYPTNAYAGYTEYPVTLGENEYFILADFRNGGVDSRFYGPVNAEEIQGTVITILRRNNL